jgi:hypothetical protein
MVNYSNALFKKYIKNIVEHFARKLLPLLVWVI